MKMIRHYMLVAFRNLNRYRAFSTINIVGLSLGLTCCLFIFLWVSDERSIDNFNHNGDRLYALYQTFTKGDNVDGSYTTPISGGPQGHAFIAFDDAPKAVPEVEDLAYYATGYELPWGHPETFKVGDKMYKLEGSRASKDFLLLMNYPVITGDPAKALGDLSSIVITRKMADLFFDSPQEAMGKSIRYENRYDFTVTAVIENPTPQSSLQFDFLINFQSQITSRIDWASPNVLTIMLLKKGANPSAIEEKLSRFIQPFLDSENATKLTVGLWPYHSRYLYSNFANGIPSGGRIEYIRIFMGVAIFILIVACINFMNLATARSVKRAKEVGVRKVIGSSRTNLIGQFLGESVLLAVLAMILALVTVQVLLPAFNMFTGKHITSPLTDLRYWWMLGGLALFTGLVAGSYPALFLSSLKPARVLKGVLRFSPGAAWFRRGLSGFQFSLSVLLLIATIVVSRQVSFVQNAHLGYDRDNLLYFQLEGALTNEEGYLTFKNEATGLPGVALVDRSSEAPHAMNFIVDNNDGFKNTVNGDDAINWEGKQKGQSVAFRPTSVGFDFVKLMKLEIADGRDFSRDYATDSADAFLVNQEAVKEMAMKDPVGKWVSAWAKKGHIVGILKDYHTNSLRERIRPLIIDVKEYENFGVVLVKTEPGKTKEALASLEKAYHDVNPNYPFVYKFVDDDYNQMYKSEQLVGHLSDAFAVLALSISCLGLLGLVMFSAEQRTKEIGIRKVLGATVSSIVGLISRDFLAIVVVSFVIAAPVAFYLMRTWLQSFAYRIPLSWWIFGVAGLTALALALVTISFQAIQSALMNPVKSLRSE